MDLTRPPTNSVEKYEQDIALLREAEQKCVKQIGSLQDQLSDIQGNLYRTQQWFLHIREIYRLAKLHFSRLRKTVSTLTEADKAELEKWIGRAKSVDGLLSIVKALEELNKFYPEDIKSNLYALVQKIIIEGPYGAGKVARRR